MLDKVTEVLNEIIKILKDEIEIVLLAAILISALLVVVILGKIIRTTIGKRKNEKKDFRFLEGREEQDFSEKKEGEYAPEDATYIEEIVAQRLEADLPDRARMIGQNEGEEETGEKLNGEEEVEPFVTKEEDTWEEEIQTFFAKEEATWEEEMKKAFLEEEKEPLQEEMPTDRLEERKINSQIEKEICFTMEKETHSAKGQEDSYNIQQPANSEMADDDGYYDRSAVNYDGGGNLQLILPSNIIEEISRLSARNLDEIEIKIQGAEVKLKYAGNTTLKNGKGQIYHVDGNPIYGHNPQDSTMYQTRKDEATDGESFIKAGTTVHSHYRGGRDIEKKDNIEKMAFYDTKIKAKDDFEEKNRKPRKPIHDGEQEIFKFEEMLEEMEKQHVKETQDTVDAFVKFGNDNYNTTKTGRVFTEKELEEQIRD